MSSTPLSAGAAVPHHAWLGEFILLASLWGASFLFMRLGAAEFGPVALAAVRVAGAGLPLSHCDTLRNVTFWKYSMLRPARTSRHILMMNGVLSM